MLSPSMLYVAATMLPLRQRRCFFAATLLIADFRFIDADAAAATRFL